MSLHDSLDGVIESLEKAKSHIPYSARLVMGTKGNLEGLERRLPKEFPYQREQIRQINRMIDQLITALEGLIAGSKETSGQSTAEIEQDLAQESYVRSEGQIGRAC